MPLQRCVLDETLDRLEETDPRAMRSRADLRRINRIMGTQSIMLRVLIRSIAPPRRIIEFGAGDGTLMLRLAARLAQRWSGVELTLLDRQRLVDAKTIAGFDRLGWRAKPLNVDLMDWLADADGQGAKDGADRYDLGIANLFMHHFDGPELKRALAGIAQRCDAFFACEPRRARVALMASHLVRFIGASELTREDAVKSVHAGFAGRELSALWPQTAAWRLQEREAGLFSHCFLAMRMQG